MSKNPAAPPAGTAPGEFPAPRPLGWRGKLFLLGFGVLLMCGALEVALRVAAADEARRPRPDLNAPATPDGQFWAIYDADLGYRQNPNYGDMNSDGLRSPPVGPKADQFRVLLLGDSVAVYGDSIEDTFPGHMRSELRKDPAHKKVEIINAGVKGYTNYQELLYLKKFGLQFQPDVVLVEFCLNDLQKFLHSFRVENGKLVPGTYMFSIDAPDDAASWAARVASRSYFLVWMRSKMRVAASVAAWRISGGYSFEYNPAVSNAWRDAAWGEIEHQLGEMHRLGAEKGFPVRVAVMPLAVQYDAAYLARDRDYVLKPQQRLKDICERAGIPFYDLYLDLSGAMFIDDGIHLTKPGREKVGQRLAEWLKQSGDLVRVSPTAKVQ